MEVLKFDMFSDLLRTVFYCLRLSFAKSPISKIWDTCNVTGRRKRKSGAVERL